MAEATELNESNVFDFARKTLRTTPLELDLATLRLSRFAASILTATLLTRALDTDLTVKLPPRSKQSLLARNGLLFAVANRPRTVAVAATGEPQLDWLTEWRRPWTRGTRQAVLRLTEEMDSSIEPSVFGRDYGAFVNPHRAGSPGVANSGVAEVVRPWLFRLLPPLTTGQASLDGREFVRAIGRVIDELVENVGEHATSPERDLSSLVLVSVARGGEVDARYRLHITVVDTGPGIVATATAKLPPTARLMGGATLADNTGLLEGLFSGEVPSVGRARGFGLPSVWHTINGWKGARLIVVTNSILLTGDSGRLESREVDSELDGTIVSAMFPLPPRRDDPSNG